MKRNRRKKQRADLETKRTLGSWRGDAGLSIQGHGPIALLAGLAVLLGSLIFAPISLWPLAFVCMVPWLILIGAVRQAPRVYFHSFVLAAVFFLINMRWLVAVTPPGYVALAIYQAVYFPLIACPVRHAVRRRRWPLAIVFPVIWTGSEMLRAVVISGFPWFYLSHSQYNVLTMIQISDLVGAYGVSFVVAAVNGAIADVVFARWGIQVDQSTVLDTTGRRRVARWGVAVAGCLLGGTLIYGQVQLGSDSVTPGPKVAIIQGDFIMAVNGEEATDAEKERLYLSMLAETAKEKPDLVVLPETPWMLFLNPEIRDFYARSRRNFTTFQKHATEHDAYIVTGSASLVQTPSDLLAKERRYNSATVFHPDAREPGRYDKVHLVYFGEAVPFRFGRLRFLYLWLNKLMPFSGPDGDFEYSLFRGEEFKVFDMTPASQPDRTYRFGVPICYEDVVPYVSREFVSGGSERKRADFLLNISNDGWYGRGTQQPQHLAICVFRAVENRVGVARAVNTGVSAFVEPTGRVHDKVTGDASTPWPRDCGYSVARLGVDSRYTLYSRFGDWFAWGCALLWLVVYVDYWIARARSRADD